jgi:hypothetical protein
MSDKTVGVLAVVIASIAFFIFLGVSNYQLHERVERLENEVTELHRGADANFRLISHHLDNIYGQGILRP